VAIRAAQWMLGARLTDPMSGFFVVSRPLFERVAYRLTGQGFKILLDLLLSSPVKLRVREVGASFRPRVAGESKLSPLVMIQFAALLLDKAGCSFWCARWVPRPISASRGHYIIPAIPDGPRPGRSAR
jgi:dolichol-phosphate mannosyltransferase